LIEAIDNRGSRISRRRSDRYARALGVGQRRRRIDDAAVVITFSRTPPLTRH
jgi:hypothetical protein